MENTDYAKNASSPSTRNIGEETTLQSKPGYAWIIGAVANNTDHARYSCVAARNDPSLNPGSWVLSNAASGLTRILTSKAIFLNSRCLQPPLTLPHFNEPVPDFIMQILLKIATIKFLIKLYSFYLKPRNRKSPKKFVC